jgi:hypothetical protein
VISRSLHCAPERPLCKPSANERSGRRWHGAALDGAH